MREQIYRRYRFRADCPVELVTDTGIQLAQARNINLHGIRVEGLQPAPPGSEISVKIKEKTTKARVQWADQNACGLLFTTAIPPDAVDYVRFTRGIAPPPPGSPPAHGWAF